MPDITDPVVVNFVNERVRPWCDRATGSYLSEQTILATWYQTITQTQEWIDADAADVVYGGSPNDGRPPLTKNDVTLIMAQTVALEGVVAAPGVFDAINKGSVNAGSFVF